MSWWILVIHTLVVVLHSINISFHCIPFISLTTFHLYQPRFCWLGFCCCLVFSKPVSNPHKPSLFSSPPWGVVQLTSPKDEPQRHPVSKIPARFNAMKSAADEVVTRSSDFRGVCGAPLLTSMGERTRQQRRVDKQA